MKKKLLSIVLSVVLLATSLPTAALANGETAATENRTLGLNFCNFSTWADNYTTDGTNTSADKLEEIEDVLAAGYVNQLFVSVDENFEAVLALCDEYDCDFWISPGTFLSDRQTIENYMANTEPKVDRIIAANAFDNFLGFWWDEPVWAHGMSNEELYTMTRALYEKWGKRNYIVFAVGAFIDNYGADCDTIAPQYTTYVTDAGWDNYSYDVRDSALTDESQNNVFVNTNAKYGTNITNAQEYYRWIHSELLEKFDHDFYTWFYPCSYVNNTHTGPADEDYCLAHLNFFNTLLSEQTKPGGLTLYTYASWSTPGIEQYLPVTNIATGEQKLFPDVAKWTIYANRVKELKTSFDSTALSTLSDVEFGNIDITNIDHDSITFRTVSGYEYSIDGGATFTTTGEFAALNASTEYTIRVKRTADGVYKDFAVSTKSATPYASGFEDTASYAMKMPEQISYYTSTYGWISTYISRNADDTGFLGSSGGYLHLKTINNERFIEVKNNNADGNSNVYLSFGDNDRATADKGISEGVTTDNLTAFAFRVKTSGGTEDQLSVFDFFINGKRTTNAATAPIKYLNKNTLEVTTLTYSSGINITGNIDGWVIVPFEAYQDLDGNSATTNLEWIKDNISNIQIWQHEEGCSHGASSSSWDSKNWYVGDVMYVENVDTFVNCRLAYYATQGDTSSPLMSVPTEESFLTYNAGYVNWGTRLFMKADKDPFNITNSDYTSGGGSGIYVREHDGEYFIILNPQEVAVSDTSSANYGKIQESNGGIYYNAVNGLGKDTAGLPEDVDRTNLTHVAFRMKIEGGEADQYSSFGIYFSGNSGFEDDLSGAYLIDYTTGTVVDPEWTGSIFGFTGEFDGWVVVPLNAWGENGREFILNTGTRFDFYFHTEMCPSGHGSDTSSSWENKTLYLGDIVVLEDTDLFNASNVTPPYDVAPSLEVSVGNTSLTVTNPISGVEYSIDGVTWQETPVFENLNYNQQYTVYAKWIAENATDAQSSVTVYTGVYSTQQGDSASYILDVPETEQYIAHNQGGAANGTYTNVWHTRLFMKSGLTDPTNGADSNYTSSSGGVYVKAVDGETFLVLDPREVVVTDETSANYGKTQESNGKVFFNNISSLETPALAGVTGIVDDIPEEDITYLAFRMKISGGEADQFSSFGIYMNGFGNLTGSYLIDKATGTVTETGWTDGHFSFTGEFDGWVMVPISAWGLTKLEAVDNFFFYFHTEMCTHGKTASSWTGKILYFGDVLAVEDDEVFKSVHAN